MTNEQIVRAATNDADMSTTTVVLGDREFKIVDLEYNDYCKFLSKLQPFLEAVASQLAGKFGLQLDGLNTGDGLGTLIKTCSEALPELVCIICKQTDTSVTVAEVKRLGKTPFKLAPIVIKQIEHNRIITEVADFFVQILPLLKATGKR